MAASVLGKRGRALDDLPDIGVVTRGKRRIQILDENTENNDPFVIHDSHHAAAIDSSKHADELASPPSSKSRRRLPRSVPAKHGPPGRRLPLSPTKGHTQRKVQKFRSEDTTDVKISQTPTPKTPRHRDALSKKAPITPKHRVNVIGKPLTPQSARNSSAGTKSTSSIYNEARKLFTRGINPGRLVGRDSERGELKTFLESRVGAMHGGCVYISGPPGTGKSALVSETCSSLSESSTLRRAYVNCMSVKSAIDIYSTLAVEFGISDDTFTVENVEETLRSAFTAPTSSSPIFLLTIDEIDQLLTVDMNALYNVFEWSLQPGSKLVLVGIANALDFTDRFLPRLKSRNLMPELIPFLPYSGPEIASVISARCRLLLPEESRGKADFTPILHPTAIQLISKKVASQSGDLRKAFDITRRVVDLVEADTKDKLSQEAAEQQLQNMSPSRTPLAENPNLSSPCSMSLDSPPKDKDSPKTSGSILGNLTAESAPRATLAHVVRVTSSTFGNGTTQRLKSLNLQQKAILCSLCALERKLQASQAEVAPNDAPSTPSSRSRLTAPTIRALFNTYTSLCTRDNVLNPLMNSEFRDVVGSLESLTLITTVDGRTGSFIAPVTPSRSGRKKSLFGGVASGDERRIAGVVGMQELESALEGVGSELLKGILHSSDLFV